MAKIGTFTTKSGTIAGTEKILGTDAGTTKLFSLSSLKTYFTQTVTLDSSLGSNFLPSTDDTYDIGSSTKEWKDLYIDGIAYIDQIGTDAVPTASVYISGGEIDGVTIGSETPAAATVTNLTINTGLLADSSAASGSKSVGTAGQILYSNASTSAPYWGSFEMKSLSDIQTDNMSIYLGTSFTAFTDFTINACNVAIGENALNSVTLGTGAGNLGGTKNIAIGCESLTASTTGYTNIGIGYNTLKSSIIGESNIAIGNEALRSLNAPSGNDNDERDNVAIGVDSLRNLVDGQANTSIGTRALLNIAGFSFANTALGYSAGGQYNQNSEKNTLVGYQAGGFAVGKGKQNTFLGYYAGARHIGAQNVAIGSLALTGSAVAGMSTNTGINNVAIGFQAMEGGAGQSSSNIAIGYSTLGGAFIGNLTDADNNIAMGDHAMSVMKTGRENIALGHDAMRKVETGQYNVAIGSGALYNDVGGHESVAIGRTALRNQNPAVAGTEMHNVAVGRGSGYLSTTGVKNTFIGSLSGYQNTEGSKIVAMGYKALYKQNPASATDTYNIGIGETAGVNLTTGIKNLIVGGEAAGSLTTGSNNIVIGHSTNVSASDQVVIGYDSTAALDNSVMLGNADTTLWHPADDNGVDLGSTAYSFKDAYIQGNVKIGDTSGSTYFQFPTTIGSSGQVLKVPSSGNTLEWVGGVTPIPHKIEGTDFTGSLLVGHDSTGTLNSAQYNTALGIGALDALTEGDNNTAIGYNAGTEITTGKHNVCVGYKAGDSITTGNYGIAIGYEALASEDTSAYGGIAIGAQALTAQNGGINNVAIGNTAGLSLTSASSNTFIGMQAGRGITSGHNNTALGYAALYTEDTGQANTAIGYQALYASDHSSSTSHNTAVGWTAGKSITTGHENVLLGGAAGNAITTGDDNVVIGYNAAISGVGRDNEIVIGHNAVGTEANAIVIGNTSHTNARVYGLRTPVSDITDDTTLTANDSGETFIFHDADGAVITLPDSGGGNLKGVYFNFFIKTQVTSNAHKVVCADTSNETLVGSLHSIDTDGDASAAIWNAQASDNFSAVNMTGVATGKPGTYFTITNMAADIWHIKGEVHQSGGSEATPFATS